MLSGLHSLSLVGRIETLGLEGPYEHQLTSDGWSRTHYDLGVTDRTEVIGPDTAFYLNPNGQSEPVPPTDVERIRLECVWMLGRHPEVRRLPDEEREGRVYSVLRVGSAGGAERDLLLDPADGALAWTRHIDAAHPVWTKLEDWRTVHGLRFPHRVTRMPHHEGERETLTFTEVLPNAPIDPATLVRPPHTPNRARIADGRSTGWIPIDLHLDRWIILRGLLNGVETEVALDSAAGATVIDAGFAGRAGLSGVGRVPVLGVGGYQEAQFASDLRLAVGPLTLELRGIIMDISEIARSLGRPVAVILGKEVFHDLVVDVDYPGSRIAFHAADRFVYDGPGTTVALLPAASGHRAIEASIDDLPPASFVIDTGSGGSVDVFAAWAERNELLSGRRTSEGVIGGVGGLMVIRTTTLRTFRFAGFELRDVPAGVPTETVGSFHDLHRAGNLGAAIFGRFRMIFDYSREQLHVEPGPDWADRPFRRNRVGLFGRFTADGLTVSHVASGSPAANAGLQPGLRIVAVDGEVVTPAFTPRWIGLRAQPDGTELRLTDESGTETVLVLAQYD